MSRPWMPLYVGDYLADTAHLRAAEHGAYLLMMMHYWSKKGLPTDDEALARIARMSIGEWRKARPTIAPFFGEDWKHKRIEFELTEAARIADAGRKGGIASGQSRRSKTERPLNGRSTKPPKSFNDPPNDPRTNDEALHSQKKETDANASGAEAPRDYRADLFGRGLKSLAEMTGKTPDSCRSTVGKWLKLVNDEAIHVLGAIDDCYRNRQANPVGWIFKVLQTHGANNGTIGKNGSRVNPFGPALDRLEQGFERAAGGDDETRETSPRLLSHG